MSNIIVEYMKLARLHSSVLTGLTPVLGAISVGIFDLKTLLILFLIGVCTHIFGFVFNEYIDVDIDKKVNYLIDKPLVSGTISKTIALAFAFSAILIGYFLIGYLVINLKSIGIFVVLIYTISWLSIAAYDLTSKWVRGSDLALATWTGSLVLLGGFAVTKSPTYLLYIIGSLAFLQLFIQNILAGLKDVIQDKLGLGTTTPLRMGVNLQKMRLIIPAKFQGFIYSFKIIHLVIVFIPFLLNWIKLNTFQLLFIIILQLLNFYLVFSIFNTSKFNRKNIIRKIGLHEIFSYSIVPLMFYGIIGIEEIILLIIIPIVWLALSLKIIYGRMLPTI